MVYNIGNNSPENLLDFVDILQQELISAGMLPGDYDFEAHKELVPMQPGDVCRREHTGKGFWFQTRHHLAGRAQEIRPVV